jgi:hypothetical protein
MARQAAPSDPSEDALELLNLPDDWLDCLERLDLHYKIDPYQKQVVGAHHSDYMKYFCRIFPWPFSCILHGLDHLVAYRAPLMDLRVEVSSLLKHLV